MKSVILKTALAVSAIMVPSALGVIAAGPSAESRPAEAFALQAPAAGDYAKFAGTYALITTEVKDAATGKWSQTPNFNSNGYIIYAPTGQMAVHIMPKIREKMPTPPTGEAALKAMQGYGAYFGTYTVDEKDKFVVHHRVGQLNPGGLPDGKRFYDFTMTPQGRERLTLTPADNGKPKEEQTSHLVWERQQPAPLSAEQKKFVGFWKQVYTDQYRMKDGKMTFHGYDGKEGGRNTTQAGTSYIIYTDSGHMMVHLMNNSGRKPYADPQKPTPEEALAIYRSYNGYFGRFITYENQNPPYVIHSQQGTTGPGGYSDQQRFYQFTGDILRLGGPPQYDEKTGELTGGHLYWQKMKMGEK